jgi:ankyrin repeat protein
MGKLRCTERATSSLIVSSEVLVEAKCEVNQTTAVKKHPILIACQKGCKKIVECLLAAGANVNIVPGNSSARPQFSYPRYAVLFSDSNGLTTPLCAATINCHKEIVDVLLAHGADVNLRDMSGRCVFDYSLDGLIQMSNDSRYGDHRAILRTLLESAKTLSCNFKIGDDNPLCRACAAGLYDVAEDLLGNEAFVKCSSDVVMCDALAAACRKNDDRLVELLLKRGAKPNGVTSALQNAQSRFQNSEDVKSHFTS